VADRRRQTSVYARGLQRDTICRGFTVLSSDRGDDVSERNDPAKQCQAVSRPRNPQHTQRRRAKHASSWSRPNNTPGPDPPSILSAHVDTSRTRDSLASPFARRDSLPKSDNRTVLSRCVAHTAGNSAGIGMAEDDDGVYHCWKLDDRSPTPIARGALRRWTHASQLTSNVSGGRRA